MEVSHEVGPKSSTPTEIQIYAGWENPLGAGFHNRHKGGGTD